MQASIPLLVPKEKIITIGGLAQSVMSLSVLIGTILGGILYSFLEIEHILYLDILGALIGVLALCLVKIPNPEKTDTQTPNVFREMKEGFLEIKNNRNIAIITIFIALYAIIQMPIGSLFPLMTKNFFQLGSLEASYLETVF